MLHTNDNRYITLDECVAQGLNLSNFQISDLTMEEFNRLSDITTLVKMRRILEGIAIFDRDKGYELDEDIKKADRRAKEVWSMTYEQVREYLRQYVVTGG